MPPKHTNRLESSALLLSALCLLHCLGIPLLLLALPALTSILQLPEAFHLYILVIALPLSLTILSYGAKSHRSLLPLVAGAIGLSLMCVALAAKFSDYETVLSSVGAAVLALAHINNWQRRLRCVAKSRS